VSPGCTRLASGHVTELRQIVPTDSPVLERVHLPRPARATTSLRRPGDRTPLP
jgi:hypothetical protein